MFKVFAYQLSCRYNCVETTMHFMSTLKTEDYNNKTFSTEEI